MPVGRFDRGALLRILYVEDNEAHAELVRRGFAGHRIRSRIDHVLTGEQALARLEELQAEDGGAGMPHVVLLDLRLPGMDGLELLQALRASPGLAKLPVIILTTSEAEWDRLKAYEHQISGYIVKPFDFDSFAILLDVISRLLPEETGAD